jgi:predicted dehydrogenase
MDNMEREPDVTRRDFLKTAALVAATTLPAAGAPAILAAPVVSNPVRYGSIGTGTRGNELLKALTTIPEGTCVATCDIYPPNLKKGVETIGGNPQTYTNYQALLDRKDIDAVIIAVPLFLHTRVLLDSLDAGKHVFVEKSMFFKEEESVPIRKAVKEHPKQAVQVGLQRRSSVLYRIAMHKIRKGALGNLTFFRAQWHRNSNWRRPVPVPTLARQVDWSNFDQEFAHSDAEHSKLDRLVNWRMYRAYSGGLMAELGSHQIDVVNWALGAEPISVIGTAGIDHWNPGGQKLLYSSILCNQHLDFNEQIMGNAGTLVITIGKGMYYREHVAKISAVATTENWWAGATVSKRAKRKEFQSIPTRRALKAGSWIASFVRPSIGWHRLGSTTTRSRTTPIGQS